MAEVGGPDVCAVILAAGESLRLGQPKQLLELKGATLIYRVTRAALASRCRRVVVVVGHRARVVSKAIRQLDCEILVNPDWQSGMASSLRAALRALEESPPEPDGVLFLTCDQPSVSSEVLDCLVKAFHEKPHQIVACQYENTTGIPALFDRSLFGELSQIQGDRGAKVVIEADPGRVLAVPCPGAAIDIDTPSDWKQALASGEFE